MTVTPAETEPVLDTSELELLDDDRRHAACEICFPEDLPKYGEPFTAACGKRAIWLERAAADRHQIPPNACPPCTTGPCAKCGTNPW